MKTFVFCAEAVEAIRRRMGRMDFIGEVVGDIVVYKDNGIVWKLGEVIAQIIYP